MTKDELLKLAQEGGLVPVNRAHQHLEPVWWSVTAADLGKFAELVVAHEREACAEEAEAAASDANKYDIADAIRLRSNV